MRHATDEDLDRLEGLVTNLRQIPELKERKRGYFSHKSRAFIHFHEHGGDLFADVRLREDFERMKVTTSQEQRFFLRRVLEAVRSD